LWFQNCTSLCSFRAFFSLSTTRPAHDPATLLKRNFESAKTALAAGDLSEAKRHYNQVIALGLRQLGNISVSESDLTKPRASLDEAAKLAPDDADIVVELRGGVFSRRRCQKKAHQLAQSVVAKHPRHARRPENALGRMISTAVI